MGTNMSKQEKAALDRHLTTEPEWRTDENRGPNHLFDVTCVIGSVYIEDGGEDHPDVAAFKLIGKHGTEGHYSFPRADGSTCHVIVEHSDPKGN